MEKIKPPKRSLRRGYMENVRKKAHKKATKLILDQARWGDRMYPSSYEKYYSSAMKNDGHWINGGCSKVNCGLCQPQGLSHREKLINQRFRDEYNDWLWHDDLKKIPHNCHMC